MPRHYIITSEMLKHCGASVSEMCATELPALLYPLLYAFEPVLPFLEVFHGVPPVLVYPSLCAYIFRRSSLSSVVVNLYTYVHVLTGHTSTRMRDMHKRTLNLNAHAQIC